MDRDYSEPPPAYAELVGSTSAGLQSDPTVVVRHGSLDELCSLSSSPSLPDTAVNASNVDICSVTSDLNSATVPTELTRDVTPPSSPIPQPSAPPKRRPGRPRKTQELLPVTVSAISKSNTESVPTTSSPNQTPSCDFSLLIHTIPPAQKLKGKKRKSLESAAEPKKFGPITIAFSSKWMDLLSKSFKWHLSKPANSLKVPVNDDDSYAVMCEQVSGCYNATKGAPPMVFPCMGEPKYIPPPRNEDSPGASASNLVNSGLPAQDEDNNSDGDNLGPMTKKDTSTANMTTSTPPTPALTSVPVPTPIPAQLAMPRTPGGHYFGSYPPYSYHPFHFPPMPGYPHLPPAPESWGMHSPQKMKRRDSSDRQFDDIRSSSPIPKDSNMTAEQFCEHARLPMDWAPCLTALGFSLEADLRQVTTDVWEAKGLMFLEAMRIKKAFKKVCRQLKSAGK
ncbi:hypothetical protein AAF712_002509 [Marasmius tenuissimus]|uniref:SAM domain-containing protein n=1 Tax=Marasmius tenuissimus TaxID=585030 RepID=A0ABR3A8M3_9AGAR